MWIIKTFISIAFSQGRNFTVVGVCFVAPIPTTNGTTVDNLLYMWLKSISINNSKLYFYIGCRYTDSTLEWNSIMVHGCYYEDWLVLVYIQ